MVPNLPWDPFTLLGSVAGKLATDSWISMMLALWNAGLWLLRVALGFMDGLLVPDLGASGPGRPLYQVTFWIGGALLLVLTMAQIGVAVFRRDGRSLARVAIGVGQFWVVWVAYLSYATLVVAAAGGLTRALMDSLLNVTTWREFQPFRPFQLKDITDSTLATALGFMGLFLLFAAVGHFLIMAVRAASLLVLVGTSPIAAAGLSSDLGRAWFWKAARWFHAAAFTPVLVVLVMGVGIQFANGAAAGLSSSAETSVGTGFAAACTVAVSVFSPLALFKLLAFVDPGTSSGAAARAGWAASGGVQGLLAGSHRASGSATARTGSPEGETDTATTARLSSAVQQGLTTGGAAAGGALGVVGGVLAAGLGALTTVGTAGAAIGADVTNQAGVGHNTYYPDFTGGRRPSGLRAALDNTPDNASDNASDNTPDNTPHTSDNTPDNTGDLGYAPAPQLPPPPPADPATASPFAQPRQAAPAGRAASGTPAGGTPSATSAGALTV